MNFGSEFLHSFLNLQFSPLPSILSRLFVHHGTRRSMKECRTTCVRNLLTLVQLPRHMLSCVRFVCNIRRCMSVAYDRCCFEKDGHGRK